MVAAGTAFLLLQRACWPFLMRHTGRLFGVPEAEA
jgi:hypothetical protein